MTQVVRIINGRVVQAWRDVATIAALTAKYGLSGAEYVTAPDNVQPGWTFDEDFAPLAVDALGIWRADASVTDIQFALAAVGLGIISAAEAEAWVARGELPAVAIAAIGALPEELRPLARIRFSGARTIARLDPFVTGPLKAVAQMTDEQLDGFFAAAGDL